MDIVGAEGSISYSLGNRVIRLGDLKLKEDQVDLPFFLRVLAACIARRVAQVLGLTRAETFKYSEL